MTLVYRTKDGDRLDQICYQHYKRVDVLQAVLDANRGLAALGPVYPSGVRILLPDITPPATRTIVRLWD
jgi:phage tail protein X